LFKVLLAAIAAGIFGTIAHQTLLASLPAGIVLSFAAVAIGALEARQEKLGRAIFPISLGLLIFVFSQDLSGDKLIPANTLGLIWCFGSVGLAALISLWPKTRLQR
jgi:hypothetical protein